MLEKAWFPNMQWLPRCNTISNGCLRLLSDEGVETSIGASARLLLPMIWMFAADVDGHAGALEKPLRDELNPHL